MAVSRVNDAFWESNSMHENGVMQQTPNSATTAEQTTCTMYIFCEVTECQYSVNDEDHYVYVNVRIHIKPTPVAAFSKYGHVLRL